MLSLQSEIDSLCAVSHELLHLGLDGEPIYSDRFRQLNTDVYHRCEHLFGSHGRTLEEEEKPRQWISFRQPHCEWHKQKPSCEQQEPIYGSYAHHGIRIHSAWEENSSLRGSPGIP